MRSRFLWLVLLVLMAGCTNPAVTETDRSSIPTSAPTDSSPTDPTPTDPTPTDPSSTPTVAGLDPLVCWQSPAAGGGGEIAWVDRTASLGLIEPLTGIYGHAAAFGDINGDELPDLVVGTFANRPEEQYRLRGADGPRPDALLFGGDPFSEVLGFSSTLGRTSATIFADLDGTGTVDLVTINNAGPRQRVPGKSMVYAGGGGQIEAVTALPLPESFSGRTVAAADFDRDGLLDLVVAEDLSGTTGTRVLHNEGSLQFIDVTEEVGLDSQLFGLGVAVGDLNADGAPDLFVSGSQQLFINRGDGTFRTADSTVFAWPSTGNEDDVAGVVFADLNRDGWPDMVIGHHFNSTLDDDRPAPIRLFLHGGLGGGGDPVFEEVTEASGLVPLPTKAPHVGVADINNDGWPDIVTSASAQDGSAPAVFRHLGLEGGIPRFQPPAGLGAAQYWVAAPMADVDQDGLLDLFLVEWEPALPSLLLGNESASGHWLEVSVAGPGTGVGTVVSVYEAGRLGENSALLGRQEIGVSVGYGAGQEPHAHFGLGDGQVVDVAIRLADGSMVDLLGVPADRHVRWPSGC